MADGDIQIMADGDTEIISYPSEPANRLEPIQYSTTTVPKQWGREVHLVNDRITDLCCKYLHINAGHQFSYHSHDIKEEYFVLLEGEAVLHWIDTEVGEERQQYLDKTKPVFIKRLLPHSVEAITDCVVMEISTFHRDDDSFRMYRK